MQRFDSGHPGNVCLARGTFNSHPYVMGAMYEFLCRLETLECKTLYRDLDQKWDSRAESLNVAFSAAGIPLLAANLSSIWTLNYLQPSRYNWMLQFYLRAQGIALGWVGTGRLIFSLDFTQTGFDAVVQRMLRAAEAMREDGWWTADPALTNRSIRRRIFRETIHAKFLRSVAR